MTPATRSLLRAAATGDISRVRALLAQDTDVNCVTAAGQTPLMLAAGFGHEALVKLLIEAGAFLEAQDELGLSALDWARNSPAITELLTPVNEPVSQIPTAAEVQAGVKPTTLEPNDSEPRNVHPVTSTPADLPPRVMLGGLAGAILREHVAKSVTPEAAPVSVPTDFLPIPAPQLETQQTPIAKPTHEINDTGDETLVKELSDETPDKTASVSASADFSTTPVVPIGDQENAANALDGIPSTHDLATVETTEELKQIVNDEGDETLVKELPKLSDETSDETAPVIPQLPALLLSRTASSPAADRDTRAVNRVNVEVPTFRTIEHSRSRTLLWLLVILVLAGGVFTGYLIMNYVINRPAPGASRPEAPVAVEKPKPVAPKPGPVVAGDLSGAELFVPDADYPTTVTNGQTGTVVVHLLVNSRGIALSSKATDGPDDFRAAAEIAGKRAAFSPEKLKGKGRLVNGTVTYTFAPPQTTDSSSVASSAAGDKSSSTAKTVTAVAGGPLSGAELNLPLPVPPRLNQKPVSGTVTVVVRVNRLGRVVSWRTVAGDNSLRAAALRAARQSTFSADKLNRKGDVVGTITYTFGPG